MLTLKTDELTTWLYRVFPHGSGDYLEMLRRRIEDLIHRNIEDSALEMYLKAGGWNPEIADVYREFKKYVVASETKNKKEEEMAEEMITKTQAKQALKQMLRELAQASGYAFDEDAELSEVRTNFATYLRALQTAVELDLEGTEKTETIDAQSAAMALSYLKEAEKVLNDALVSR